MSMVKIIVPGSQQFGDTVSRIIKIAGSGRLRGDDLDAFVKRAGHQFADTLRTMSFAPGEIPIHMYAIGSTEAYGPNRNGDGFKEATCQKYHPTFVKHARWYRNHANKDPRKSYGIVKASAYNPQMRRIELIAALNGTKEAALRNGGLVADKEQEKLARHDDEWGVSMACRVPFDVCSGCQKQARHRGEYCTAQTCKYGGLTHNITKVAADGHVLHADNPDPTFFDISDVYRPADRIAFVLGHAKAASGEVMGGAALAEEAGVGFPYDLLTIGMTPAVAAQIKIAYELAAIEDRLRLDPASFVSHSNRAVDPALRAPVDRLVEFGKSASSRAQALAAMADVGILLPVQDFISLALGEDREKTAQLADRVADRLPGLYSRLISDENLEQSICSNPWVPMAAVGLVARRWAEKAAADHSFLTAYVEKRVMRSALVDRPVPALRAHEKQASDSRAEELAKHYAMYKLATLARWSATVEAPRMFEMAVRENYVAKV